MYFPPILRLAPVRISSRFFALLAGFLLAVPTSGQVESPLAVAWEERIEVASGDAYRGPWRMNESEFHYVDDPTVAINAQGVVGVAWADQTRKDIFFQIYEPTGAKRFEEPINVSRSPQTFSWLPRLAITSGDGTQVYLLWQEIVFSGGSHGGEIFFAQSRDSGRTFSHPINLSNTPAGAGKGRLTQRHWHNGSLDLALGPGRGNLYVVWTEYEGALWFSRSMDGGHHFTEPRRIAGDNHRPARGPSLTIGIDGDVYLAWAVGEDQAADIHFARSSNGGRSFSKPRSILASEGHSDAPKIAVDSERTIHLVYAESSADPLQQYHIRYAQSKDKGQTFQESKKVAEPREASLGSVNFPTLSRVGSNRLYVLWERFPSRRDRPQGLGFASSNDSGQTFSSPIIIPGSADPALGFNGSQQGLLMKKLAVNEAGAIAVVNSTFKKNKASHIWLFRGQAATWR
jgi:hypothetical protein